MTTLSCDACGGENLEAGHLQSTGLIYQRLKNSKFAILEPADIPVNSRMCLDCGHIMLFGETEKANRILKKEKEAV